jgi:hypothetical protein
VIESVGGSHTFENWQTHLYPSFLAFAQAQGIRFELPRGVFIEQLVSALARLKWPVKISNGLRSTGFKDAAFAYGLCFVPEIPPIFGQDWEDQSEKHPVYDTPIKTRA